MPSLSERLAGQTATLLPLLPRHVSAAARGRLRQSLPTLDPPADTSPAVAAAPCRQVQLVDAVALQQRLGSERGRDRVGLVEQLSGLAQPKELRVPTHDHWQQLQTLQQQLPHMAAVLTSLLNRIKLQVATQQPLKLSPTLLLGPPGNGKSHLMHCLAEILTLPTLEIQLGGNADNLALIGTSRHWGSAAPGKLALFLAQSTIANPLVLLEEIDKSALGNHGWTLDILLVLLEPENARRFEDKFVEVPMDLRYCTFLATANSSAELPAPLRNRFQSYPISAPQRQAWPLILQQLYAQLRRQEGRDQLFQAELPEAVQAAFLAHCPNIRELRKRLETGFDAALARFDSPDALLQHKGDLLPLPPEIEVDADKPRIGFF